MTNLTKDLEKLGLSIIVVRDVYIGQTPNKNLLIIYYAYDKLIEEFVWELVINNSNTTNCYYSKEKLLKSLENYMKH